MFGKKESARKKRVVKSSTNTDCIYTAAASLEILDIKAYGHVRLSTCLTSTAAFLQALKKKTHNKTNDSHKKKHLHANNFFTRVCAGYGVTELNSL